MTEFKSTATITAEIPLFKEFVGKPVEQMAILLGATPKRTPIQIYRILDIRVDDEHPDQKNFQDIHFTAADQAIRDNDSYETKIVRYEHPIAQELAASLQSTKQLVNWSLPVNKDTYHGLEGDLVHVIPADVVKDLLNNPYSRADERQAFWEFECRGDTKLFGKTLKLQTDRGRTLDNSLGFYPSNKEGMWLVWVGSVGDYDSLAYGDDGLGGGDGRLVGELAPEVLTTIAAGDAKNSTPAQKQIVSAAWDYIKNTPATDLTKKGLEGAIRPAYRK